MYLSNCPASGTISGREDLCISVWCQGSGISAPAWISGMLQPFVHCPPKAGKAGSCLLSTACSDPSAVEYMPWFGSRLKAYLYLCGELWVGLWAEKKLKAQVEKGRVSKLLVCCASFLTSC